MDIRQMDQTNWVCYKFAEDSYYYGEVGLLDNSGIVHPKDNTQMAAQAKLVKHGYGIYIYNDPQAKIKYQGNFEKGKKCGKGKLVLKDGSNYEGNFKDDQYHDYGVMKFNNGDIYDGKWKKGRMDGPGILKKQNGQVLKGSFKNNYFIDGKILRNPFQSDSEYEKLKKKRKQIQKQYEKNQKAKNGYFQRISKNNHSHYIELIEKSWKNNRIPFVTASQQAKYSIDNICQIFQQNSKIPKIIDLRKFSKSTEEDKFNYKKQITTIVQNALREGHYLILSLDDSSGIQEFDDFFYPDIKQLYQPNGMNQCIWAPVNLNKPEIKSQIIGQDPIHQNFGFLVWSKVKISQEGISDGLIRQKNEKRFDSIVPYIKVDLIFMIQDEEPTEHKDSQQN